jgi:hypothetical protein
VAGGHTYETLRRVEHRHAFVRVCVIACMHVGACIDMYDQNLCMHELDMCVCMYVCTHVE